jgi:hypothetical protein
MAQNFSLTNVGVKGVNLLTSNDPDVWQGLGAISRRERDVYYARVAAAFRAFNLKANTVGNMPFALIKQSRMDTSGKPQKTGIKAIDDATDGEEFDNTAAWQNKVGFLPNPSELLRLNTLSYMVSNAVYNLQTSDALGYKPRGLYNAISYAFTPWTNPTTAQVDYIERQVGTMIERYAPDGKQIYPTASKTRLVYMWRLDHTTEVLPSANTEAEAIMSAAGILHFKNFWIRNFYERGGIKPTLISVKGMVDTNTKEAKERSWSDWLKGIGKIGGNIARLINGEAMDAKTIGDGVSDMKDNMIHQDALADIAMGTGMPLSLLVANSANYATAKEEKATWYENDIIPLCNWMAYEYNRQIFEPLGLRMEFHPETLDPQQEDETERASAMVQYASVLEKVQSAELFFGLSAMMGLEVPDELHAAIETFYADKEQREKEMQAQMQGAGVVIGPDGKPLPVSTNQQDSNQTSPNFDKDKEDEPEEEEKKPVPPAKKTWTPSLDEIKEISTWHDIALRHLKKAGNLAEFDYLPHHGGVPAEYGDAVKAKLATAQTPEDVRAAFDVAADVTPAPAYKTDEVNPATLALAESINKLAEVYKESGK